MSILLVHLNHHNNARIGDQDWRGERLVCVLMMNWLRVHVVTNLHRIGLVSQPTSSLLSKPRI